MEKTVRIKVWSNNYKYLNGEYGLQVELTEEQLRQALKEIEDKKNTGWHNSYGDGATISRNLVIDEDKEYLWPTKQMALAARKLCKAMWEYEFDPNDFSNLAFTSERFKKLADEQD